jgi:FlaA1/EpsC-like NDP-sugar epimerase
MQKSLKNMTVIALFVWDILSVILSAFFGQKVFFGFDQPITFERFPLLPIYILISLFFVVGFNVLLQNYTSVWKHAGISEMVRLMLAVFFAFCIIAIINWLVPLDIHKESILIAFFLDATLMICARLSMLFQKWVKARFLIFKNIENMKRVLIIGAGESGMNLAKRLESNPSEGRLPIGFVDDNEAFWGRKINRLPIFGGDVVIPQIIKDKEIDEVIIAVTNMKRAKIRQIFEYCKQNGCHLKRFGTIAEVNDPNLESAKIGDVNLEDLLGRNPVRLDMDNVRSFIGGKTVMVTGGAGSIGSEICRQVLSFGCEKLIIFDIHENGLFDIKNELLLEFEQSRFEVTLGSVRDSSRINEVFETYHPQVIFHAAAHKHVPMMEINPKEAIKNNVFGTINLAKLSIIHKVEKFILISTDKAVNPTNIMGASKRIAELIIQVYDKTSVTEFAAVRFGNVLGSNGSVVPFFKNQISLGGPVTVTHPDVRRYFMTIPEAVQLVLEASAMAKGGEIFVLDMGEPVKIYDLACDLIRLSGHEPNRDIDITFIGLRPGEKLFEELSLDEESVEKTKNNKIYICKSVEVDSKLISSKINDLQRAILKSDINTVVDCVKKLVPSYKNFEQ